MKRLFAVLTALALALSAGVCALAEGGDGSGGGSGNPLALDWSSVPDGSTDVPTDTAITLTFNKNVVNFTVKDNNMGCFTLVGPNGSVPILVIMGDDQVDPSVKRIITISPDTLMPGETYTLIISGGLQAKNGTYLGSDVSLTFTTAGSGEAPPPAEETPAEEERPSEGERPAETDAEPKDPEEAAPEEDVPEKPAAEREDEKPAEPEKPPVPDKTEEPETPDKGDEALGDGAAAEPREGASTTVTTGVSEGEPAGKSGADRAVYYISGGVVAAAALALVIFRKKK